MVIFNRYSWRGLWLLFLVTAFPIHLWTIILGLRDFSWVAERTNAWDAVGVVAYGMVFAFFESVIVFALVAVLGFLLPKQWKEDKRIAFMSLLILVVAIWAIIGQLFFLLGISLPTTIVQFFAASSHPLRLLYAGIVILVSLTVLIPVYILLRSEKLVNAVQSLIERLALLSAIYLFFDVIGLFIIIIRNLT